MEVSPRQRPGKDSPPQPLQTDAFRKDELKAVASFPASPQGLSQPGTGTQHPTSNARPSHWAASHPEGIHPKHPCEHTENAARWKRSPQGKAVAPSN